MKHILVLSDFSDISEAAVDVAFRLAQRYGAALTIYHQLTEGEIITLDLSAKNHSATIFSSEIPALQSLRQWKSLSEHYGVPTKCKLCADPLPTAVATFTTSTPTDLIVMGATGFGRQSEEYYWGSHTQKVVHAVDAPVLVVNRPVDQLPFQNIVFASSFDQAEKEVFYFFLKLLDPHPDATLHLLSIDTLNYFSQPSLIVQQAMRDFAAVAQGRKVQLHFYEDTSIPAGIQHFITEIDADLLVMSHKFDHPIRHLLRGDHTLKMVDRASIPVLTLDYQE